MTIEHPKARERIVYDIDFLNDKQNWRKLAKDKGEETWVKDFNF